MKRKIKLILILLPFLMPACANVPQDMKDSIYTEAAQTMIVQITETALANPPTETATTVPTATETPVPSPTAAPIIIPTVAPAVPDQPTASAANPYQVEFVWVDPYPNQFRPNQTFVLSWRLKNVGTATWSGKYRFYHHNGIQLANQPNYPIDVVVQPNETLTISMPATAPNDYGTYQTEWAFANPDGVVFYYVYYTAIVGEQTFITEQPNQPTNTPSSLYWMCSDPDRSNIQGNGCEEFCRLNGNNLRLNGLNCYASGVQITDFY